MADAHTQIYYNNHSYDRNTGTWRLRFVHGVMEDKNLRVWMSAVSSAEFTKLRDSDQYDMRAVCG